MQLSLPLTDILMCGRSTVFITDAQKSIMSTDKSLVGVRGAVVDIVCFRLSSVMVASWAARCQFKLQLSTASVLGLHFDVINTHTLTQTACRPYVFLNSPSSSRSFIFRSCIFSHPHRPISRPFISESLIGCSAPLNHP